MKNENFKDYLNKINKYKDNISLILKINGINKRIIKYDELFKSANKVADILKNREIHEVNRIAICVDSCAEIVSIILGILQANYAFCPISPNENIENLLKKLAELECKHLILPQEVSCSGLILKHIFKVFETQFYLYEINDVLNSPLKPVIKYCYCITTSGTTGKSKVVNVTWDCIWPNIKYLSEIYDISSQDVILPTAPTTFDPFILDIFLALNNGAAVLFLHKIVPDITLYSQQIFSLNSNNFGVTIMQITPSVFQMLSNKAIQFILLDENSSLRVLTFGGEPFPSSKLLEKWIVNNETLRKRNIFNIFGITEVSCWASVHKINELENCIDVPLGKSIDSETILELRDCDKFGANSLFKELYIGSKVRKCLLSGEEERLIYESKEYVFRSTGDLVENVNGNIFYRGRTNSVVKRFGHRVSLSNIENEFLQEPNIVNAVCIYAEENNELLLFLKGNENFNIRNSINKLKDKEKPNKIIFMDEFPININGKIAKDTLLEDFYSKKLAESKIKFASFNNVLLNTSILNLFANILKIPLDILKTLTESDKNPQKMQKTFLDSSFLSQGGTSVEILNLINELQLQGDEIDPKVTEMLFDINCPIVEIIKYIDQNSSCQQQLEEAEFKSNLNFEDISVDLHIKWKYDTKKCVDASPTLHKNYVCVGSHSSKIVTVNSENGTIISSLDLPDRIESQITFSEEINNDFGFVGCYDGYLYKFNPTNGVLINKFNSEGMIKCKPLAAKEFVIFGNYSEKNNLFCLNKNDFSLKWSIKLGQKGILSSPILLENDLILVCTLDGTCSCLNLINGKELWIKKYNAPIFSTSVFIKDYCRILLSEVSGGLHLIDLSGNERSFLQAGGNIFSSFEFHKFDQQMLAYFGCYDNCLYCIRIEDNHIALIRKIKLQSTIYSTPKLISINGKSLVVCSSSAGIIEILDIETGRIIKSLRLNGEIFSSSSFKDGKLYVGCRDNYLYCIETEMHS